MFQCTVSKFGETVPLFSLLILLLLLFLFLFVQVSWQPGAL